MTGRYPPVPVDLTPFRAGVLWRCAGLAYVVIAFSLSENVRHEGIYQFDGRPVGGQAWSDGPTVVELVFDRAEWAQNHDIEHAFDTWLADGPDAVCEVGGQAWRVLVGTVARTAAGALAVPDGQGGPDRAMFRLYRAPELDSPDVSTPAGFRRALDQAP